MECAGKWICETNTCPLCRSHVFEPTSIRITNLFVQAIINGDIPLVRLIHENCIIDASRIPESSNACCLAVEHGHIECLEYLYENNYLVNDDVIGTAIRKKQIKCLEFFLEKGFINPLTDPEVLIFAIECEHLDIVVFLHEKGWEFTNGCIECAEEEGYSEILAYIRQHLKES